VDASDDREEASAPDPCEHASPPGPPPTDPSDDGGANLPEFELALSKLELDVVAQPGLDLDGVCTCDARSGTANGGASSCVQPEGARPDCDLDGGADNAIALLERDNLPTSPITNQANSRIREGAGTLLISVAGYNGRANDDAVVVGAIVGVGLQRGCADAGGSGPWEPGRCGDDTWLVSPDSVVVTAGARRLPLTVGAGYVRDFRLVARFKTDVVRAPFNDVSDIRLSNAILALTLVPLGVDLQPRDPSRAPSDAEKRLWRVEEGVIAGALDSDDALFTLGTINTASGRLCALPAFEPLRDQVCRSVDLASGRPAGVSLPKCNAISGAAKLRLDPARAGDAGQARPPFTGCDALRAQGGISCK
jgi:hypothetical protein